VALLLDGGFVKKKVGERLGHFPAVADIVAVTSALMTRLAGLISNSSRIIAFRNRLIHGYASRRAA
jgi:hypothetical protein